MERRIEALNEVYKTIAQLTSVEDCLKIYNQFRGLTVNFPTKLVDVTYVRAYLESELNKGKQFSKKDIQHLSLSLDYSERQIRRFLSDIKKQ